MMKDRGHLLEKRKKMAGIWLAAPALLGTFLFFLLPFAICIKYSFTFGVGGACGKPSFPLYPFAAAGAANCKRGYGGSGVFCRDGYCQSLAGFPRGPYCPMAARPKCLLCPVGAVSMEKLWV